MTLNETFLGLKSDYARNEIKKLVAETPFVNRNARQDIERRAQIFQTLEQIVEGERPKQYADGIYCNNLLARYSGYYEAIYQSLNPEKYSKYKMAEKEKEILDKELHQQVVRVERRIRRKNTRESRRLWIELGGRVTGGEKDDLI